MVFLSLSFVVAIAGDAVGWRTPTTTDDAAALVQQFAPGAPLEGAIQLDLSASDRHKWSADVIEVVVRSRAMASVQELRLDGNHFGHLPGKAIAASKSMGAVRWLDLSECDIGDTGAQGLRRARALDSLVHLDLDHNGIGTGGLSGLAQAIWGNQIQSLSLSGNAFSGDDVAAVLADPSVWPGLQTLVLDRAGTSEDSAAALQARLGDGLQWADQGK